MLRAVKDMVGLTIAASDGDIGKVGDLYFDDEAWVVRYLVVETGTWLSNRKVLVSPMALHEPNWDMDRLPARLTREQVRNCPGVDTDKPVSRQHEVEFYRYYGYPYYWGSNGLWGGEYPAAQVDQERTARAVEDRRGEDPNLRSYKEVTGYHIGATDGEIGHVQGMLVDEQSWAIRYLVANTSNWWMGHQVLVSPEWITDVLWLERRVTIDLTRQAIQDAPPYDAARALDRPEESLVYGHYGRAGYWHDGLPSPSAGRTEPNDLRSQR